MFLCLQTGPVESSYKDSELAQPGRFSLYGVRENESLWDEGQPWHLENVGTLLDALPENAAGITTPYCYVRSISPFLC